MGVNQGDVLALDLGRRDRMDTGLRRYDGGEGGTRRASGVSSGWTAAVAGCGYARSGFGFGLRAQAARAHSHLFSNAGLVIRGDRLNVDVPASSRLVVRVADVISKLRAASAELTFCHSWLPA